MTFDQRTESCTTAAMDWAAGEGHLEIVEWIHGNRKEGGSYFAMDLASKYEHFEE